MKHPDTSRPEPNCTSGASFVGFAVLTLLGLAGNYFSYNLFFNVDFLFGSIFPFLVVYRCGLIPGVMSALIASSYTYILWNHPYAVVIFTLEMLVSGYLYTRRRQNLIVADALFWLVIGMPLVWLFWRGVMRIEPSSALLIMFKQAVNGIANALLANSAILYGGNVMARLFRERSLPQVRFRHEIFSIIVAFVLLPALLVVVVESRQAADDQEIEVVGHLKAVDERVTKLFVTWMSENVSMIKRLAVELAGLDPARQGALLQEVLDGGNRLHFTGLAVTDENGRVVAQHASPAGQGMQWTGRDLSGTDAYQQVKKSLEPSAGTLKGGSGAEAEALTAIFAPIMRSGRFSGCVVAALEPDALAPLLSAWNVAASVLDRQGGIAAGSGTHTPVLSRGSALSRRIPVEDSGVFLEVPKLPPNTPAIQQWKRSVYVREHGIDMPPGWTMRLEASTLPLYLELERKANVRLGMALAIIVCAIILSSYFSGKVVGPLNTLETVTAGLPRRLSAGDMPQWPESSVTEISSLVENFKGMSESLRQKFDELANINLTLETMVQERTADLLESEEKFRSLAENIRAVFWLTELEPAERIIYVSPAVREIWGLEPEDVMKEPRGWIEAIHPDDRARVAERFEGAVKGSCDFDVEYRIIRPDGTLRWVHDRGYSVSRNGSNIRWLAGIAEDITERKLSETLLRESRERYREVVEGANSVILRWDKNGNILFMNPYGLGLFGFAKEELFGRSVLDTIVPAESTDGRDLARMIAEIARDPDAFEHNENENTCKNGTRVIINWTNRAIYNDNGEYVEILSIGNDVTSQRMAELRLRESERRFKNLVETTSDWIWETDAEGRYTYASPQVKELLGYAPEDVLGRLPFDFMPKDEADKIGDFFRSAMRRRQPFTSVLNRNIRKDGREIILETSGTPVLDERGALLGYRGIDRDVTERLRMEEELIRERKLESLGVLAGGIAHDFNNLLQGLLGNISMAKLHTAPGAAALRYLESAEHAYQRASALTGQLITFSKGGEPVRRVISLEGLIRKTAEFSLSGSNIKLDVSLPQDLWPVNADDGQISQVLQNLILNARDAMPGGGLLSISAENCDLRQGDLPGLGRGQYVKVRVTDEGAGIPHDIQSKIFDPYFTTKAMGEQKGVGLGLTVCYSIVRNHGGLITAASEPGKGSTFSFYLPAIPSATAPAAASAEAPQTGSGRVLVMDDEPMVANLAAEFLRVLGYLPETAPNGAEAVRKFTAAMDEGNQFRLVLLDLTIPGEAGGMDVLQKLRMIDPAVKAIVTSGYATDPVMTDFRLYGFDAMIVKPYTIGQLSAALGGVMKS